ncbi:M48 family metallopeptidase [Flavobacterium sp. I-STPA6A]|uniref:M48 family metallopeptidase n=1 Tax=Flavobacterium sp. I-STPA6A TaxID=2590450 RepID=UPI00131E2C0B|nr:SprT family zinc-dependent metalloprotease [Flavobacterium sp. I-STPA6A]
MQLEYEIKFSKRKTLNITVERDRKIIVRAPLNLSIEKIEEIVQSKRQWLKEKINHTQKYPIDIKPKEFISGETLLYLGRNYQLLVVDEPIEGIEFNQRFRISRENQEAANKLFKAWYMKQALSKIEPLAKMYATNLGVKFNEFKTSQMKYRWGSCTPNNNIIFNWRIIKAPMYVLEYLVAHELVHLIEENHTPRFWNILSIQVPNYQKAKNWLKINGHLLEVDF